MKVKVERLYKMMAFMVRFTSFRPGSSHYKIIDSLTNLGEFLIQKIRQHLPRQGQINSRLMRALLYYLSSVLCFRLY
jgi:hypothetical protein